MWVDVEQNTEEWLELRAGKITGSKIACIMANDGKAFGEPAKKYAIDLAVERIRGSRIQGDRYTNQHMEAGHVEEPVARALYEEKTGRSICHGGFFDNGNTGCSPDGIIVFENRIIEIKSVIPSIHFKTDKTKTFDSKYKWQILFNMVESDVDYVDYISYCEQYVDSKKLIIVEVAKKDYTSEIERMHERIEKFEALISENMDIIKS